MARFFWQTQKMIYREHCTLRVTLQTVGRKTSPPKSEVMAFKGQVSITNRIITSEYV
jgi:hypothetical protein